MLSWDEIGVLVHTGELQLLLRTPAVTDQYRRYKLSLADRGLTVVEAVVLEKLHWDSVSLSQLAQHWPTASLQLQAMLSRRELFKLLKNDFPYDFPASVHHLVLWSKVRIPLYVDGGGSGGGSSSCEKVRPVEAKIQRFLDVNLARHNVHDFVWFVNYPHLQSVTAVSHIHVLVNTSRPHRIAQILKQGFQPIEN
ncbi:LAME_0H07976g1_1 [Lachancea meyersii CBS 8951]|uniref:LAME_0H07976g1_1 n=1 Tax=Lachancea meyersii CBS 8951 TaxID=1266667 RepID=A0A1G4KF56_9SACH|nr:LAME_0H07976g1_1 [Lachancea meyersii CBS 8951]